MTYEQLTRFAAALDTTWKEAVINELVVAHIYQAKHDTDPRQAIQDAISWNTSVALDPLVSSDAQKLIKQGAAVEREACAKLAREIGNATEPDDWALDKCEEIETAIRARALK